MEAGLRSFFAKELLSEDTGPPIRPDFVVTALFSRKTNATIEYFPKLFSSSSGNETTFRTVEVLLTLVEKIINKFHHSKCSSLAETKNYREIADNT